MYKMCATHKTTSKTVLVISIAIILMANIDRSEAQRMDAARFLRTFVANTYTQASFIRSHFRP